MPEQGTREALARTLARTAQGARTGTFDVAAIGWGKGGKTLAGTLARVGKRVAMIEW